MEHIIKESPEETIKRFELGNGDIWVIKQGDKFGVGQTKREAMKLKTHYARTTIPPFLYNQGTTDPKVKQVKLWALPGMVKFINQMLPLRYQGHFIFQIVYCDASKTACLIVKNGLFSDFAPVYFWCDEPGLVHDQIRYCVYQFYIQRELKQMTAFIEIHKKLGEWQNNWYSKLQPKRF